MRARSSDFSRLPIAGESLLILERRRITAGPDFFQRAGDHRDATNRSELSTPWFVFLADTSRVLIVSRQF